MQQPRAIHWILALGLALALHLLFFLHYHAQPRVVAAQDPGARAITIALAPEPTPELAAQPIPESKPTPKPKPKLKPKSEPKPVPEYQPQAQKEPIATPVPEPAPPAPSEPAAATTAIATTAAEQTAQETQSGATGGIADTTPDYRSQISAWLERHKEYPLRARRLGQEGTVVLHFIIDRSGQVLEWDLRTRSGYDLLDDAVARMIKRSNPLPAMPASMTISKLELTVPVNFNLR